MLTEEISKSISRRISVLMKERGLKRYSLAVKCSNKLSKTCVYEIANGETKVTVESLSYICDGLGVSLKEFFDFENEKEINLSHEEAVTIEAYRELDERRKGRLLGYLEMLQEEMKNEE